MFDNNLIGRWMAAILGLVGIIYLAVPLLTRGPVGHIPPDQRSHAAASQSSLPASKVPAQDPRAPVSTAPASEPEKQLQSDSAPTVTASH